MNILAEIADTDLEEDTRLIQERICYSCIKEHSIEFKWGALIPYHIAESLACVVCEKPPNSISLQYRLMSRQEYRRISQIVKKTHNRDMKRTKAYKVIPSIGYENVGTRRY